MADVQLSANFWLSEFERASERPLTPEEIEKARWWATQVLQPLRRQFGRIKVSSYVRREGNHASGEAVDAVLLDHGIPAHEATREAAIWLGTYHPDRFGKVIHELADPHELRDHLHITRPGFQGAYGEVWIEQPPGASDGARFVMGAATPAVVVALGMIALLVLLVLFA